MRRELQYLSDAVEMIRFVFKAAFDVLEDAEPLGTGRSLVSDERLRALARSIEDFVAICRTNLGDDAGT